MNRYHFHNVEKRVISDSFFRLQQTYLIRLKSAKNNDTIYFYSVSRNLMHQDSEFHMASAQLFSVNVCRIIRIITQQFMILFPLRLHLYCDFFSCKIIENDNFFLLICSLICKNICVFSFQKFNTSFRNYFLFSVRSVFCRKNK